MMTLTDGSKGRGRMTVADVYTAWNRLRVRLKKAGLLDQFAAVLEVQRRGALHLHVLSTGAYIHQPRLVGMAKAAGFGLCTDIREITKDAGEASEASAAYASKQMAGYLTKQNAEALTAKTNKRRRPLRTSRGWGLSLREALAMLTTEWLEATETERDIGPWAFVQVLPDGDLFVRIGESSARLQGDAEAAESSGADEAAQSSSDGGAAEAATAGGAPTAATGGTVA